MLTSGKNCKIRLESECKILELNKTKGNKFPAKTNGDWIGYSLSFTKVEKSLVKVNVISFMRYLSNAVNFYPLVRFN